MKRSTNTPLKRKALSGFTLIELIVVVTILAILATIGFLALSGYSQDAKDSSIKANVRSVFTAISSEAAVTWNSPRYYVVNDSGAALSGAVAFVDGNPIALTGWDWNAAGTNYSAGNPDYAKLKLNPEKFKVSFFGPEKAFAAYDAKFLLAGAFDWSSTASSGKKRAGAYLQVAGIAPATGMATVAWNYPGSSSAWAAAGLVKDPKSPSSTGALVDGGNSSAPPSSVNGVCGSASKNYAFSAASFGSDTFCSAGTASPVSPGFPAAGGSVSWTCSALNGGNVPTCAATRAAAANCSASTQTVNGHSYSLAAFNNGSALAGTSAAITVTGGNQTYSQTFACADGAVSTSGSETAGTLTCTAAGYASLGGACVPNSCLSIKNAYGTSPDGTYAVDPDGAGAVPAFNAYCDMNTGGGGWTVIYSTLNDANPVTASSTVTLRSNKYLDISKIQALANVSSYVYIKDAAGNYVKTVNANANPIVNMRSGKTMNAGYALGYDTTVDWTGTNVGNLAWLWSDSAGCHPQMQAAMLPNFFWGCGIWGSAHMTTATSQKGWNDGQSNSVDIMIK